MKKIYFQILVLASLLGALLMVPASAMSAMVEDESTHEAKSGIFMKPSSGLDIKPDIDEQKKASRLSLTHLPLSHNIDIAINDTMDAGLVAGKPQKQDIPDKKHSTDHRALLGITFHF